MCKRFIETNIWKQSWFLDLTPLQKQVWFYLNANCDYADIWDIDLRQLKRDIGIDQIDFDYVLSAINRDFEIHSEVEINANRIKLFNNNRKLWITNFISAQYEKGTKGVNASVLVVKSALNRLKDEGILDLALNEGFVRVYEKNISNEKNNHNDNPSPTLKEKEKEICCDSSFLKTEGGAGGDSPNGAQQVNSAAETGPVNGTAGRNAGDGFIIPRVEELFHEYWGGIPKTPGAIKVAENIHYHYGEEEFIYALIESAKYNKLSVAYVDGICKKRAENAAKEKAKAEAREKEESLKRKVDEEKKSGVKWNLVEEAFNKKNE